MSKINLENKQETDKIYRFAENIEKEILLVLASFIILTFVCIGLMVFVRIFYREKLKKKITEIHQVYEPSRIFIIENAGNQAIQVVPPVISPPITDQTEYNVVAAALRDEQKGNLF